MATSKYTTKPMFHDCTICGTVHPFTAEYFSRSKGAKFGLHKACKVCLGAKHKVWRERNAEAQFEYHRQYYQANRERHLESKRQYREANREKVLESTRRTYRKRRGKYLQDKKRYVAENREKLRTHWRNMRALRMNAPGKHTEQEIEQLYEDQEGRCGYCGITLHGEYQVEHIRPLARGGSNDIDNLVCACVECNQTKHTSTFEEWKARRGW